MTSVRDKTIQKLLNQLDTLIDLHYKVGWTKEKIPAHWAIDALFSKSFGHFKAIVRLFKGKAFIAESLVLLRSAYENTLLLCYILTDPDNHITQYQNSSTNYALRDVQRFKERNPSPPAWIEDYETMLQSQTTDKMFRLEMKDYLKHLKQVTPGLFDDNLTRFYSIDMTAYFYGTSIAHSHPHALQQLYIDNTPYVGVIGVLHCILGCSRLIRIYMSHYGCKFPEQIEPLDTAILEKLKTFNELREGQ